MSERDEWGCRYEDWEPDVSPTADRALAQGWVDFAVAHGKAATLVRRTITTGGWEAEVGRERHEIIAAEVAEAFAELRERIEQNWPGWDGPVSLQAVLDLIPSPVSS